jgi:8-oxo-dGTP pyrophosphatase MutT (NUDIX family)
MDEPRIVSLSRLDLSFTPKPWRFEVERRAEIDAHFAELQTANPHLWNGRVLLMHEHAFAGEVFRGAYLETDFASFMAWRNWNFPDRTMTNCFALGALQSSDGALMLGVMAPHTSNPGKIYFAGGTPEPVDVVAGKVDLQLNAVRELAEETGLSTSDFQVEPGWHAVLDGPRIAMMKTMRASLPAEVLRARIVAHFPHDADAELSDIRIVRSLADLDPMMPDYMAAYLRFRFAG